MKEVPPIEVLVLIDTPGSEAVVTKGEIEAQTSHVFIKTPAGDLCVTAMHYDKTTVVIEVRPEVFVPVYIEDLRALIERTQDLPRPKSILYVHDWEKK